MKGERWFSALWAFVLGFVAMFGGLGAINSAFKLGADLWLLALGCMGICFVFGLTGPWKHAWITPVVLALLCGYWWQEGTLRLSFLGLLHQISVYYDLGYGWGIVPFPGEQLWEIGMLPGLLLVGVPVGLTVTWATAKGKFGLLGGGVTLLPLFSCLILTDMPPEGLYVALLMGAVLLILLTESVRSRNIAQGNRLTAILTLPVALAVAALFLLLPQGSYQGQEGAQKLEDWVTDNIQGQPIQQNPAGPAPVQGDQEEEVDLQSVGNLVQSVRLVMKIRAQESGFLYLRGAVYDTYDGKTWSASTGWDDRDLKYSVTGEIKKMEVETQGVHSARYFTYGPFALPNSIVKGQLPNTGKHQAYTVSYRSLSEYDLEWEYIRGEKDTGPINAGTLPTSTWIRAEKLLAAVPGLVEDPVMTGQIYRNAVAICDWVRDQARYDLGTDPMPEGETDFALWFLEESGTGYCTHFASAAVVMLRAAGIPARYVTGYLVDAEAGRTVNVTMKEAHAWVEAYIGGIGWMVMEPTPGAAGNIPEPDPTVGTEPVPTESAVPGTDPAKPTETKPVPTTEPPVESGPKPTQGMATEDSTEPGSDLQAPGKFPLWPLWVLLTVAAVVLQWRLRVWIRDQLLGAGGNNLRALRYWRYLCLLERQAGGKPARELYELARKARFSQHTLTDEELGQLAAACGKCRQMLRKAHPGRQLLNTLILALY